MNNRTCNKCGRVAFAISRKSAEENIQRSEIHTSESHIKLYEHCIACGESYKNFRESQPDDCPRGCTLAGIIDESME